MPDAGDETLAQKLGFTAEDSAPEPTRHDPPPSPPAEARGGKSARSSRLARRRRVLLAVGVAAVLLSVGGLIGAAFVKSPAQLAADTAPPANTVTTAKVTSQVLTSSVAMRGVVYPSSQYDIAASGPASQLYISRLGVTTGTVVQNGQFLAEIDGEPMFALAVTPSSPLPAGLNGENVLVTVQTGQTEGPVLTVPVAAVVTTASGQSVVTVAGPGGKQTNVRVTPGLSENGYVQVTRVTAGSLAAGDNVVVSG